MLILPVKIDRRSERRLTVDTKSRQETDMIDIKKIRPAHRPVQSVSTAEQQRTMCRPIMALAILAASLLGGTAAAQTWPQKPVRVIVASVPGGTIDVSVRTLANKLAERFKQPFVIDNRGGAGGTIAAGAVARSPADGYTLLGGSIADQVINVFIRRNSNQTLPYDPEKDFVAVALIERGGNVLVAHPSLPVNSLAELISAAKAKPGSINFGSGGIGQTTHLSGELFKRAAGIDLLHVPYRGNAPASADLLAGTIKLLFASPVSAEQNVRAGKVKALAVTTETRLPGLPNVPTFTELGLPDVVVTPYILLLTPSGTPPTVIQLLNLATVEIMTGPESCAAARAALGWTTPNWTPEQVAEFMAADRRRWQAIIMGSNIRNE